MSCDGRFFGILMWKISRGGWCGDRDGGAARRHRPLGGGAAAAANTARPPKAAGFTIDTTAIGSRNRTWIAQGPGAGLYLSRIVATALGKPPVPLPEGDPSLLAAAGLASVAFLLVGWVGRLAACCCLRRASPEPTRTAATEEPLLDEE